MVSLKKLLKIKGIQIIALDNMEEKSRRVERFHSLETTTHEFLDLSSHEMYSMPLKMGRHVTA